MREFIKKHLGARVINRMRAHLPASMLKRTTYSQFGEDLIIKFVLSLLRGSGPIKYLDIGANHPFHMSNTALFYQEGGQGVLVEPDPTLVLQLQRKRPRDKILACGVHFSGATKGDFFLFNPPTLNTFSREEMERYVTAGHKLLDTLQVEMKDVNSILEIAGSVDFMSLDIEGIDKEVLKMIDWTKHRPTCLCVETVTYEVSREPTKFKDIIEFMLSKDYILYADTYVNSIFVDKNKWKAYWSSR